MSNKASVYDVTPDRLQEFVRRVMGPHEIDPATAELGMPARLLNPYLATEVDLSAIGMGRCLHIPVQITQRDGGRKSLYFLDPGEEVIAGIYVNGKDLAFRNVTRKSGQPGPAKTGDTYRQTITKLDGSLVMDETGQLEIIDASKGYGLIRFSSGTERAWVIWSCIDVTP